MLAKNSITNITGITAATVKIKKIILNDIINENATLYLVNKINRKINVFQTILLRTPLNDDISHSAVRIFKRHKNPIKKSNVNHDVNRSNNLKIRQNERRLTSKACPRICIEGEIYPAKEERIQVPQNWYWYEIDYIPLSAI